MRLFEFYNKIWLTANDQKVKFENWCQEHDLDETSSWALQLYINEVMKADVKKENDNSFFFNDGFFVRWNTKAGACKVETLYKHEAQELFVKLATRMNVILGKIEAGEETILARSTW